MRASEPAKAEEEVSLNANRAVEKCSLGLLDLGEHLLLTILARLDAREITLVQACSKAARGIITDAVVADAACASLREEVTTPPAPCSGAQAPPLDVERGARLLLVAELRRNRIDAGDAIGRLLEKEEHSRPLCFDIAPHGVVLGTASGRSCGWAGLRTEKAGARNLREASVSAVCGAQRMRGGGTHHADFHMDNFGTWCRVGIARASFDPLTQPASSMGPDGWAWSSAGSVWHDGQKLDAPGLSGPVAKRWEQGDVVGMRLDLGAGTLAAYLNGALLGVIVKGLTGALFCDGFCWSVDLCTADVRLHIVRGESPGADLASTADGIV